MCSRSTSVTSCPWWSMSPRPASPQEAVLDPNSAVLDLYLSSLAAVPQEARRQGVSPRRMSSSTLSDGRSPVAAGVEGANRREKDAFSEVPPVGVSRRWNRYQWARTAPSDANPNGLRIAEQRPLEPRTSPGTLRAGVRRESDGQGDRGRPTLQVSTDDDRHSGRALLGGFECLTT